jgi:hypothetical protein
MQVSRYPSDHFNTDADPAFQSDTDPGLGPHRFKELMYLKPYFLYILTVKVPKTVLFIQINLIFLVSRYAKTQPVGMPGPNQFSFPVNFVVLLRVVYGSYPGPRTEHSGTNPNGSAFGSAILVPVPVYCINYKDLMEDSLYSRPLELSN